MAKCFWMNEWNNVNGLLNVLCLMKKLWYHMPNLCNTVPIIGCWSSPICFLLYVYFIFIFLFLKMCVSYSIVFTLSMHCGISIYISTMLLPTTSPVTVFNALHSADLTPACRANWPLVSCHAAITEDIIGCIHQPGSGLTGMVMIMSTILH